MKFVSKEVSGGDNDILVVSGAVTGDIVIFDVLVENGLPESKEELRDTVHACEATECQLSEFSEWSSCMVKEVGDHENATFDNRLTYVEGASCHRVRKREIITPALHSGPCPDAENLKEEEDCVCDFTIFMMDHGGALDKQNVTGLVDAIGVCLDSDDEILTIVEEIEPKELDRADPAMNVTPSILFSIMVLLFTVYFN